LEIQSKNSFDPPGSRLGLRCLLLLWVCSFCSGFSAGSGSGFGSAFEGDVINILSPHIIGVAALQEGNSVFQTIFSVRLQFIGRFVASLIPLWRGPLQCGQFSSAWIRPDTPRTATIKYRTMICLFIIVLLIVIVFFGFLFRRKKILFLP